ncbi:MAG: 4Fe-4S dicluster domain-containing protein [Dehalococcoidia bacterium]
MQGKSVLIVDDEPIVRESIRDWLKDAGYHVYTAQSGEEALTLIEKQDFSIMVLDIRLPGKTGIKVLNEVKAQRPWIRSIIITAYPSAETIAEAKKLGAIDYLVKPVNPENLEKLIKEALGEAVSSEIAAEISDLSEIIPEIPQAEIPVTKKTVVITKDNLRSMVESLGKEMEIVGVQKRQAKYIYNKITRFDDLCLDYDVTYFPPTKYFLPEKEVLLKFKVGEEIPVEPIIEDVKRAIIGIHPYDIKAIELLDEAYLATNPDPHYSARRQNTIIIGVDCLNPSPNSFASSMGTNTVEHGFDLLLTDIGAVYVVTVGSSRGAEILEKHAQVREPKSAEIALQKLARDEAASKYKLHLSVPKEKLPRILEESYDDPYWETRSETCLSCGSCVLVCPTCFCFDVRDEVSLNLKDGERVRYWDGCILRDFAKVATGENFRHDKESRFRHRLFRKGKYILERHGKPGCVGCGRCTTNCLADIASPVEAFNALVESVKAKEEAARIVRVIESEKHLYYPDAAELLSIRELTPQEKAFEFRLKSDKELGHRPGQFVEVSIMGIGEAPISISSSPTRGKTFQLAVRNVGDVTSALHDLKEGATVGIRGPYGNGFPMDMLGGKDILFIAGGIGLFPLRSLIQYVIDRRDSYGKVTVLYGARSRENRLFTDELSEWDKNPDIEFYETVDVGDDKWKGHVGVITTLIPQVEIDADKTVAIIVGPPVFYRFVIGELKRKGLADEDIVLSLERRMKCGVGKCGHCQINGIYVCHDGPVFTLAQLRNLREAVQ